MTVIEFFSRNKYLTLFNYYFLLSSGCQIVSNHRIQVVTNRLRFPTVLDPTANSSICLVFSPIQQMPNFDAQTFADSLTFDKCFQHSKRLTAYFGNTSYNYSRTKHTPTPLSANSIVQNCITTLNDTFTNQGLNSVLINYYPDANAMIPFHADDEADICNDSYIFTLSIGSTRTMTFRNKVNKQHMLKIALSHGSLICFSKLSQNFYEHAVLTSDNPGLNTGPRISLTFRKLL